MTENRNGDSFTKSPHIIGLDRKIIKSPKFTPTLSTVADSMEHKLPLANDWKYKWL